MATKFETKFSLSIHRLQADGMGCGYCTVQPTLTDALSHAYAYAMYYCGAGGAHVSIVEQCAACGGSGITGHTRTRKPIACKACKGVPAVRTIDYHALPHENCTIHRQDEQLWPATAEETTAAVRRHLARRKSA
jgi:hypothetical protein